MIKTRLWELRTEKGITLSKLSKLSGICKTTINDIENGKISPRLIQLEKIAKGLNVDTVDIIVDGNEINSVFTEIESKNIHCSPNISYNLNRERVGGINMKEEILLMIYQMLDKLDADTLIVVYDFIHRLYISM